jgi:hypothetical protein
MYSIIAHSLIFRKIFEALQKKFSDAVQFLNTKNSMSPISLKTGTTDSLQALPHEKEQKQKLHNKVNLQLSRFLE